MRQPVSNFLVLLFEALGLSHEVESLFKHFLPFRIEKFHLWPPRLGSSQSYHGFSTYPGMWELIKSDEVKFCFRIIYSRGTPILHQFRSFPLGWSNVSVNYQEQNEAALLLFLNVWKKGWYINTRKSYIVPFCHWLHNAKLIQQLEQYNWAK